LLELHARDTPLLLPNPWDAGSAKLLEAVGFEALATTSSGFAATLGRRDGSVTRAEALTHAAAIAAATGVPVSADLENGFADAPADVAQTVRDAIAAASQAVRSRTSPGTRPLRSTASSTRRRGSPPPRRQRTPARSGSC
jgi:2-methylisocitrate lyase-like PEP mutase family enzyme